MNKREFTIEKIGKEYIYKEVGGNGIITNFFKSKRRGLDVYTSEIIRRTEPNSVSAKETLRILRALKELPIPDSLPEEPTEHKDASDDVSADIDIVIEFLLEVIRREESNPTEDIIIFLWEY